MDTQPTFGLRDLLAHLIGDMARAIADRPSEGPDQRAARIQAAIQTIMAFRPIDAIEAMLAGHCLMFHELIVDSVQHTMRGEEEKARRPTRSGIVAMDRAFGANLARLERYRTREAEAVTGVQSTDALTETKIADRVRRHQHSASAHSPSAVTPDDLDPVSFPRPLAMDRPDPAGAAVQMSGINSQDIGSASRSERYAYAGNRQARRHAIRHGTTKPSVAAAS